MSITNKKVNVSCKDCNKEWLKRSDSLICWSGRCKSCASKELASRPYMKEIMRKSGLKVTARYGGVPNARKFTHEMVAGEKSARWKGGITPLVMKIRNSLEYKNWRISVFRRDNFTCQFCKKRGGKIEADHIKPFAYFPELRLDINNGRTLCKECHKTTDTYLGKSKAYATT